MSRTFKLALGCVPCVLALSGMAFAQDAGAGAGTAAGANAGATNSATATTPPMAADMGAGAATTQTTTTTTTAPDMGATTMPKTGGDPASWLLVGTALSGSMLVIRRRFAR